jgi:hypothetical protein
MSLILAREREKERGVKEEGKSLKKGYYTQMAIGTASVITVLWQ